MRHTSKQNTFEDQYHHIGRVRFASTIAAAAAQWV